MAAAKSVLPRVGGARAEQKSAPDLQAEKPAVRAFSSPSIEVDDGEPPESQWEVDRGAALPNLVDDATAETVALKVDPLDDAPTARPQVVELPAGVKGAPVNAPMAAPPPVASAVDDDQEDLTDEPTVMRQAPLNLDSLEEELADEPTVMRQAPTDEAESEESSDEPTVIRLSPKDQAEEDARKDGSEPAKPSQEPTHRGARVELSPEVLAQAAAELGSTGDQEDAVPGSADVTSLTRAPSESVGQHSVEALPTRPAARPRSASRWGLVAAMLVLVTSGVVIARQKGWISGGLPWQPATVAPMPTEVPSAVPTVAPTGLDTAAPPVASVAPSTAPSGDAVAVDAGVADAAVDAAVVDAGAVAAVDAGVPPPVADAGAATAEPPVAPVAGGAPPKDPKSLSDKRGYLKITTPTSLTVYVQGANAGLTNEWLEVDCGPKFVRVGEPPANAPPGAGAAGVKWRSDGKSAVVTCRGETTLPITPTL